MTPTLDERLIELARLTASELARRAAEKRLTRINERDHLQPACVAAARALTGRDPWATVSTTFRVSSGLWPRLGRTDLALLPPDRKPIALELKCGSGRDALGPCAWDALKLAFALQVEEISACYLLAAAPEASWTAAIRGSELFETCQVDTLDLRERYLDWWRQWERLDDPLPGEVPRRFGVRAVARVPVDVNGNAWELRLAAVVLEGSDRIAWPPTRQERPPSSLPRAESARGSRLDRDGGDLDALTAPLQPKDENRTPSVSNEDAFPPDVARRLKTYVYRLIDPRNGETFYVGKGRGNRVFAHIRAEKGIEGDELDNKLKRIREIRLAGFEVAHVIHRHGMEDATAFEVEAALMDAYPGLTNVAGGYGTSDFGAMHAREINRRYAAPVAVFQHRALLISVNRSAAETSLYEATRYAWKISRTKALQAEIILATLQGLIVGAFVADDWLPATSENFPGRADAAPGRLGFVGREAPEDLRALYVGKRVPDEFRKPGAANPIKYTWR